MWVCCVCKYVWAKGKERDVVCVVCVAHDEILEFVLPCVCV